LQKNHNNTNVINLNKYSTTNQSIEPNIIIIHATLKLTKHWSLILFVFYFWKTAVSTHWQVEEKCFLAKVRES